MYDLRKWNDIYHSSKQKANSQSSTEANLIGMDDKLSKIVWIKRFLEGKGVNITANVIFQDNQSVIKLANNEALNVISISRYFTSRI